MQQHVYDSADISSRMVYVMSENTFDALMAAYKRGAADYLDKAAYDYADKITSTSRIRAETVKNSGEPTTPKMEPVHISEEQVETSFTKWHRNATRMGDTPPNLWDAFVGGYAASNLAHNRSGISGQLPLASPANSRAEAILECERAVEAQFDWSLTTREVELLSRCRTALRALLDKEPKP